MYVRSLPYVRIRIYNTLVTLAIPTIRARRLIVYQNSKTPLTSMIYIIVFHNYVVCLTIKGFQLMKPMVQFYTSQVQNNFLYGIAQFKLDICMRVLGESLDRFVGQLASVTRTHNLELKI